MAGLLNWPPARGKNPHTHKRDCVVPAVGRKDLPKPKRPSIAVLEKAIIDARPKKPRKGKKKWIFKRHKQRPQPELVGRWKVGYQVTAVANLTPKQAVQVLRGWNEKGKTDWWQYKPRSLRVTINYPLSRGIMLKIAPMKTVFRGCEACGPVFKTKRKVKKRKPLVQKQMTIGYFMWVVAKEYERIYRQHRKYGVWGHGIGDLWFEMIQVEKDGVVRLGIGS